MEIKTYEVNNYSGETVKVKIYADMTFLVHGERFRIVGEEGVDVLEYWSIQNLELQILRTSGDWVLFARGSFETISNNASPLQKRISKAGYSFGDGHSFTRHSENDKYDAAAQFISMVL